MWWLWLSAGAVIGFIVAAGILGGKANDLQDQVDNKCRNCPLMADWEEWQRQESSKLRKKPVSHALGRGSSDDL